MTGLMTARPLRVVLDTNVVISGLLWNGPPRTLLEIAMTGEMISLVTSRALIQELAETLDLPKFDERIAAAGTSSADLVAAYRDVNSIVSPRSMPRVVADDLEDDHVIAAALEARADCIVTGDRRHLLPLGVHEGIAIISPQQCLEMLGR